MTHSIDTKLKDLDHYVYLGEYEDSVVGKLFDNHVFVDSRLRKPSSPQLILYAKKGTHFLDCYERVTARIRSRVNVADVSRSLGQSMYGVSITFNDHDTIQDVLDVLKEIYLSYVFILHLDKVK